MKNLKNIIYNLTILIFSVGLSLAAMEIMLPRLHIFQLDEAVYQVRRPVVQYIYGEFHPDLKYTLQKNLDNVPIIYENKLDYRLTTNNEGFRGPDWDFSPARRNIILLGDSFAFGWGVAWEDTTGQLLERQLQRLDSRFQVINLAMSGYSIKEIVRVCELYRERLRPEAIVYLFCPNDLESMTGQDRLGSYNLHYRPERNDAVSFAEIRTRNQPGFWTWDKFRRGSYLHAFYARYVRPLLSERIRHSLRHDSPPPGYVFPAALDPPPPCSGYTGNTLSAILPRPSHRNHVNPYFSGADLG